MASGQPANTSTASLGQGNVDLSIGFSQQAFKIALELGPDLQGVDYQTQFRVDPSPMPTIVDATVTVLTHGAKAMTSPGYLGVIRRKRTSKLIETVTKLADVAGNTDFNSHAFPIYDDLVNLLNQLMVNESAEGNTCAILRRLRNCMMDDGVKLLRQEAGRTAIIQVLRLLSEQREVESFDVRNSSKILKRAGLRPTLRVPFEIGEANENEEAQISD